MLPTFLPDDARFLELLDARHPASATLVIGSSPQPSDHERARIALRDMIDDAMRQAEAQGTPHADREALRTRMRALIEDEDVWRYQSYGMLVLATPEGVEWFRLPFPATDRAVVGDRFDLRTLLQARSSTDHVFVLQLSQGLVRLGEVTAEPGLIIHELHLPDDLRAMLQYATNDGRMDRESARGSDGERPERERFARAVNEAVARATSRAIPLLLVASDDFRAAYRAQNTHPLLLDEEIPVHPESLADRELEQRARDVLRARHERAVAAWKDRFGTLRAQGRATSRLADVAAAAAAASIEELRLDQDAERSGTVDAYGRVRDQDGAGGFLLMDLAADVLRTGGRVWAVPRAELTDGAPVAAVLRYPTPAPDGA